MSVVSKMRRIFCYLFKMHDWVGWDKENRSFITCKYCGKTREQIWDDFSSYYYCDVGTTKEKLLDMLAGGKNG